MEQKLTLNQKAETILSECATVLPYGFQILLYKDPVAWRDIVKEYGSHSVCDAVSAWLSKAYQSAYGEAFLFSESCLSFEFHYHLNAYLCTQGFRHLRHVTTLAIPKKLLERACRSVEIDTGDVWKWSQRLMFRYFFGIRKDLKRTERDPYCKKAFGKIRRVPFIRKPHSSVK